MTRLGCLLLLLFVAVVGGFALVLRRGGPPVSTVAPQPADPPVPAPTALTTGASGLVVPVSGVTADHLRDTWGEARGDGKRAHHAIDILASRGTPVVAAAAGTVEKIFESRNGGHTIYVRRTDPTFVDYYAHLDSYAPSLVEGAKIGQGQWLGAVGSTGDASPDAPHLHYEIKRMATGEKWWQGTEIDPYPILAGKAVSR